MDGPHLAIRIEPSRILCAALLMLHAVAMVAPWCADLPSWLRLSIALVAGSGLIATWRQHRAARRAGPWRLGLQDGAWSLERGVERHAVELLGDTTVWESLVVLRLRCGDARVRSLPVLPDCCSADELRRLRAVLRTSGVRRR